MIGLPGEYKLWNFGDEQQSFVYVKSSLTVSVTKSSLGAAGNRTWVTEDNFVRRTLFTMLMFNSNPAFEESMIEMCVCILNILPTRTNFMISCNDWQPKPHY